MCNLGMLNLLIKQIKNCFMVSLISVRYEFPAMDIIRKFGHQVIPNIMDMKPPFLRQFKLFI